MTDRATIRLDLEALPDAAGVPAFVRLRRLLKALKRAYGWRCLRLLDVPAELRPARGPSSPAECGLSGPGAMGGHCPKERGDGR